MPLKQKSLPIGKIDRLFFKRLPGYVTFSCLEYSTFWILCQYGTGDFELNLSFMLLFSNRS